MQLPEQIEEISLSYKNKKEVAKGGLLGFFIGLAVIIPGISGSTIAIIFRLYEKLIYSMANFFKRFKLCFLFLLPIVVGIGVGFILGFFVIKSILDILPFAIIALFAGLMLGAFPSVSEEIKNEKKTPKRMLLFLIGLAIPIAVGIISTFTVSGHQSLENLQFYHFILFIVLGYVVAITQIVPGLSATAILMAFGYFKPIMKSVSLTYWQENPMVLLVYACLIIGFLIGLVTFSKVLTFTFQKAKKTAFFCIVGLSLGSIISMFMNPDIYEVYVAWANGDTLMPLNLGLGIPLFIVGGVVSYLFVQYERKKSLNLSPAQLETK